VLWAVAAVLLARLVVVYGLSWFVNRWTEPVPLRWQHVLTWGGLRGAISLALALSLPAALGPQRDLVRVMTFGVVLFTLLAQGMTIRPLIRRLGLITRSDAQVEYELRHGRLAALRAGQRHLDQMHREGLLSTPTWERLKPVVSQQAASLAQAVRDILRTEKELRSEELDTARRELFRAQRSALLGLRRDGVISEEVFEQLAGEVDAQLDQDTALAADEDEAPARLMDVEVAAASPAIDRSIADLKLPREAVVVSVARAGELIIPRGDTRLRAGDIVTLLSRPERVAELEQLLAPDGGAPPA
jgi:CPA1 family monovalent cation:H+ antiporter